MATPEASEGASGWKLHRLRWGTGLGQEAPREHRPSASELAEFLQGRARAVTQAVEAKVQGSGLRRPRVCLASQSSPWVPPVSFACPLLRARLPPAEPSPRSWGQHPPGPGISGGTEV